MYIDGVCVRGARLRDGFDGHDATSFTESATVRGVALLALAPFAVRPIEAHGHQCVEMAGPNAEGQYLRRAGHGHHLDPALYHHRSDHTPDGDIRAVA